VPADRCSGQLSLQGRAGLAVAETELCPPRGRAPPRGRGRPAWQGTASGARGGPRGGGRLRRLEGPLRYGGTPI